MARPEDSRRVEDARRPDLGTDRPPAAPEASATTQPDLEDLPVQSPGSDGLHRLLHRAYDHDEGVVRVPGVGTSSSRGAAFPCDGASLRSLDVPADRRGLRSPGCAPVSAPRSKPHLRQGSSFANLLTPDRRSAHRRPESLAESLRRTPYRLDPQGLPGPFHYLQRAASETNPEFLFHLLSRIEDSFRTRQAMSACSAGLECRNDRPDSAPRWPASPLRTHGSVMLCLRTHFGERQGLYGENGGSGDPQN